jgi:phosphoserine phosphatase
VLFNKIFIVMLGSILLAGAASAARRPRNPRKFKKTPVAAAPLSTSAVVAVPARRKIPRLAPGRWDPAVKDALEDFIADRSSATAGYDPERPPVAVLPWGDAAVIGDAGFVVFRKLVERADFKFDDEFWGLVPLVYGRQRIRAAYEIFSGLPVSVWESQPEYHQYRKAFLAAYSDMCSKAGRGECRAWLSSLLKGFTEEELLRYAQGALREKPLREIPEIKDLVGLLLRSGFDVWVIDSDNQKILETAAKQYGVDPSRSVGLRLAVAKGGKLAPGIVGPILLRSGKVEAAVSAFGRPPQFVIAAAPGDAELLRYGAGLGLVLDGGDAGLRRSAEENGWLIHHSFAAGSASAGLP